MLERYEDPEPDSPDEGLDEYLCEYVDGSMDPSVRDVFEEYLASNPRLAEHVACLCRTRNLLAHHRHCPVRSDRLHHRLHLEIARDLMGESQGTPVWAVPSLGSFASLTSAVGLMMILGMLFGSALVRSEVIPVSITQAESLAVPSDAHALSFGRFDPPPISPAVLGLPAPVSTLPIVASSSAMTPMMGPDQFQLEYAAP